MSPFIMYWSEFQTKLYRYNRSLKLAAGLFSILFSGNTKAQVELTFFAGTSHYSGDLGSGISMKNLDMSELNFASTRFSLGAGARVYASRHWAFRGNLFYGRISGDDKYTDNIPRRNRNLSFFSPLFGINLLAEYHMALGKSGADRLYFLTGFEYFYFNPKTHYQGEVVALQPLGTEGQYFLQDKAPYSLSAPAIVFGGGINILYTARGRLSLEVTGHRTFTDYLDDVSTTYPDKNALLTSNGQTAVDLSDRNLGLLPGNTDPGSVRGNPGYKDNFFFISLCYSHVIGKGKKNAAVYRQPGGRWRSFKSRCFDF